MYQFDNNKRFNISIRTPDGHHSPNFAHYQSAELIAIASHFIALRDDKGKEHVYSGNVSIEIHEA